MKRFFLYAMMAGGILASCSQSENDDLSQDVTGGSEVQSAEKISLSASSPNVGVDVQTRAGSVGADQNRTDEIGWKGETLYIYACEKEPDGDQAGVLRKRNGSLDFMLKGESAYVKSGGQENSIEWGTATTPTTAKYYNREGAYAFFGCHIGDLNLEELKESNNMYGLLLQIDGTQDLMNATAEITSEMVSKMGSGKMHQAFSAFSARHQVEPKLEFQHQLTRLSFKAVRGGENDAEKDKAKNVCVKSIKVKSHDKVFLPVVYDCYDSNGKAKTRPIIPEDSEAELELKERTEEGLMQPLTQANCYLTEDKQIGEALMIYPKNKKEIEVIIELYQEKDANDNLIPGPTTEGEQDKRREVIKKSVKLNNGADFQPGHSYNLVITVYSLQDVSITAKLTNWENAGDVNVNEGDFEDTQK